ncbi:MAG: hypothetical protein U5N86_05550 [Planctomycetota bacterium]|nr:hypothetical protein [Planctomycetota bacterium]
MRDERGAVLIIVAGGLALMFLTAMAMVAISNSDRFTSALAKHNTLVRISADSALSVCLAVIANDRESCSSASEGLATVTSEPDKEAISDLATEFLNLTEPDGRTAYLTASGRKSVLDLRPDSHLLRFWQLGVNDLLKAYTNLSEAEADARGISLPNLSEIPDGVFTECSGTGTLVFEAFGRSTLYDENRPSVPVATMVARATIELQFRAAVRPATDDEYLLVLFFPSEPNVSGKRFGETDEDVAELDWPR